MYVVHQLVLSNPLSVHGVQAGLNLFKEVTTSDYGGNNLKDEMGCTIMFSGFTVYISSIVPRLSPPCAKLYLIRECMLMECEREGLGMRLFTKYT